MRISFLGYVFAIVFFLSAISAVHGIADDSGLFASPGTNALYSIDREGDGPPNCVKEFTLTVGPIETIKGERCQWFALSAVKLNGQTFRFQLLGSEFPPKSEVQRYIFQEGEGVPHEYIHAVKGKAVLPTIVAPNQLWPQPIAEKSVESVLPLNVDWLGNRYKLVAAKTGAPFPELGNVQILRLQPDVLIGLPSNARTKDDIRRFDGSDYEMVRLTRENYAEMIRSGVNCLRVDAEQAAWIKDEPVFYWGIGGGDIPYPEALFRSNYIGPSLFYDEPGVSTRDYDVRPRLEKDPEYRHTLTHEVVLEEFKQHFHRSATDGPPFVLAKGLQARQDVCLGTMDLSQRNLYTWETIVAAAAWELTAEPEYGPQAFVFEPPGRIGSRRTLTEMNMVYGCQLSPDNPANFTGIIFGFLRGAARAAGKEWGVSIYGAVDRSDAPWWMTHAYDLGATRFFFWDNYQSACVPFGECLALTRHFQAHVQGRPERDIARLRNAGEVLILLPPGYDLGHTHTGRGNLWGLNELNLERKNRFGIKYRQVMGNFFTEIERCLKLDVPFDLLWDLDGLKTEGYREIVRIQENGEVEVITDKHSSLFSGPRIPGRFPGRPPELHLELSSTDNTSGLIKATAEITAGTAPIYYTTGANRLGIYPNVAVLWELYGPGDEDYRTLSGRGIDTSATIQKGTVEARFMASEPGHYRLRVATTDLAGRSCVVWKEFDVAE